MYNGENHSLAKMRTAVKNLVECSNEIRNKVKEATELEKRLLADTCELCGSKENIEVHHIRKLADVKNKGLLYAPTWAQVMAARNRKTLVVCRECHVAIHNGTINKPLS